MMQVQDNSLHKLCMMYKIVYTKLGFSLLSHVAVPLAKYVSILLSLEYIYTTCTMAFLIHPQE